MLAEEYQCRKCGKVVSIEQYRANRFCPDCKMILYPRISTVSNHWMFQFKQGTYRWFDWIKRNPGNDQWLVSQHVEEIRKGDHVAIWASGAKGGVCATGEIMTNPRKEPIDPEQAEYWKREEDAMKLKGKPSVRVKYHRILADNPLSRNECRGDPVLSRLAVLRSSQGTNFRLRESQWKRILELVQEQQTSIE